MLGMDEHWRMIDDDIAGCRDDGDNGGYCGKKWRRVPNRLTHVGWHENEKTSSYTCAWRVSPNDESTARDEVYGFRMPSMINARPVCRGR